MSKKILDLADVLSVTTGIPLPNANREYPIDGIYLVMNHVTGNSLMTHQLTALLDEVTESLYRQHPFLEGVEVPEAGAKDTRDEYVAMLRTWIATKERIHGKTLEVETDPSFGQVNPLDYMPEGKEVIVVEVKE